LFETDTYLEPIIGGTISITLNTLPVEQING